MRPVRRVLYGGAMRLHPAAGRGRRSHGILPAAAEPPVHKRVPEELPVARPEPPPKTVVHRTRNTVKRKDLRLHAVAFRYLRFKNTSRTAELPAEPPSCSSNPKNSHSLILDERLGDLALVDGLEWDGR